MFQVGGTEKPLIGSADSDCQQGVSVKSCSHQVCGTWSKCRSVTPGSGADSCTEEPDVSCYTTSDKPEECRHMLNRESVAALTYSKCRTGG